MGMGSGFNEVSVIPIHSATCMIMLTWKDKDLKGKSIALSRICQGEHMKSGVKRSRMLGSRTNSYSWWKCCLAFKNGTLCQGIALTLVADHQGPIRRLILPSE